MKRRWLIPAVIAGAVAMIGAGAFAASKAGTFNMQANTNLAVTCPNSLTNSNVAANSETVNCAANPTTTTVATTTTVPATTTTQPVTTTTVPSGGGGSTCTSAQSGGPQFKYAGITNSNGFNTTVTSNIWGGNPGTTATTCANPDPSNVTSAVSAVPADYTGVQMYAEISQLMNNYCGSDTWNTCGSPTDTVVSDLHALSSTYNVADPPVGTGDWEAAYDIWVSNNPNQNEIMIWTNSSTERLNNNGSQICATNLNLGGQVYTYQAYPTCNGGTPQFVLQSNASSGTVDILAVLNYLVAQGIEPANMTLGELDYGWEVCNTAGQTLNFTTTGYTLSMS